MSDIYDNDIEKEELTKQTQMNNESPIYIEDEIKASYLDYSMSVIVSRALPDVRDGLKPVHRRILYAMNELGMTYDKAYKKSARIVGEVLGKYHPHGDSAIYNAMVRLAQDFSTRYELIQGHGNFGSIDGDGAAAMRYTEARMSKIASELLEDINKNTIDFRKNFDESLEEPVVLPAKLPNLLINGTTGIAVGMATNIPPHNLTEIANAVIALIEDRNIAVEGLMEYVTGPDFPTGGIINGKNGIYDAYKTGRGRIKVMAKVDVETSKSGKESIIVNEIPYGVNKSRLIESIANLVKQKKISGITDLRDESDRDGIRIVIEIKKGEESEIVLNNLYKYTDLQTTFGIIMLSIVNNVPKVLNLKEILNKYLQHRYQVITRRTEYDLAKAEARLHILEGLKIALDNIDEIIETIKTSKNDSEANQRLISKFGFTEIQSKAILDMRLKRITGLERQKIEEEYNNLIITISDLRYILSSDEKKYSIIKEEVIELRDKFGDNRRTVINEERTELMYEDLIKDEDVVVTITRKGYIKRITLDSYKGQKRGGIGTNATNTIEDDEVQDIYIAKTLDTLLIFTDKGKVHNIKVYEIPQASKQARGKLINNLIKIDDDESASFILKARQEEESKQVLFITKQGLVKKTSILEYKNITRAGKKAIGLVDDDELRFVGLTTGTNEDQIFIATEKGQAVLFEESKIRSMGRGAKGVKGVKLSKGDNVISAAIIDTRKNKNDIEVLTITENGYGKRTKLKEYRITNRGTKGIKNFKLAEKTGNVICVKLINPDELNSEILLITDEGTLIRTVISSISTIGRVTSGVKLMKVRENEKIVSVVKFTEEVEENE